MKQLPYPAYDFDALTRDSRLKVYFTYRLTRDSTPDVKTELKINNATFKFFLPTNHVF